MNIFCENERRLVLLFYLCNNNQVCGFWKDIQVPRIQEKIIWCHLAAAADFAEEIPQPSICNLGRKVLVHQEISSFEIRMQ